MKNLKYLILSLAFLPLAVSCSSDDDDDKNTLPLDKYSIELNIGETAEVTIKASGQYLAQSENPEIAKIVNSKEPREWLTVTGKVTIEGVADGETKITVKDDKTNKVSVIKVKVTDPYKDIKAKADPRFQFNYAGGINLNFADGEYTLDKTGEIVTFEWKKDKGAIILKYTEPGANISEGKREGALLTLVDKDGKEEVVAITNLNVIQVKDGTAWIVFDHIVISENKATEAKPTVISGLCVAKMTPTPKK